MSDPYYSLYCKQRELQRFWQPYWACGFASLVTCFRILGDRTTENDELVARFRAAWALAELALDEVLPATTVPATALVDWEPPTDAPDVLT